MYGLGIVTGPYVTSPKAIKGGLKPGGVAKIIAADSYATGFVKHLRVLIYATLHFGAAPNLEDQSLRALKEASVRFKIAMKDKSSVLSSYRKF